MESMKVKLRRVKWGAKMKPGDIEGKQGCNIRRFDENDWVANQHLDEEGRVVGLECVSTKKHWWLDTEIERPDLRDEDWMMAEYFGSREHRLERWQVPWAWEYECAREWQPWGDFERCREVFQKEAKRLKSEGLALLTCGPREPFWIYKGFEDAFPETPWIAIPNQEREKRLGNAGITRQSNRKLLPRLEGRVRTLKRGAPQVNGYWDEEGIRRLQDWQNAPGDYDEEKLENIKGHYHVKTASGKVEKACAVSYIGTYVIRVPWDYPDDVLDQAWKEWRTRHKPKEQEPIPWMNRSGKEKPMDWLRQIGALRLLRRKSVSEAMEYTEKRLKPGKDSSHPLYPHRSRWTEAQQHADWLLARHFGVE